MLELPLPHPATNQARFDNLIAASRMVGLLSRYYADICNPLHTDQSRAEERMHSRYQSAVNRRSNAVGEHRSWIRFNGHDPVLSAATRTRFTARYVHTRHGSLVRGYNAYGFDSTVLAITKRSLNRAVNGLADIIITKRKS